MAFLLLLFVMHENAPPCWQNAVRGLDGLTEHVGSDPSERSTILSHGFLTQAEEDEEVQGTDRADVPRQEHAIPKIVWHEHRRVLSDAREVAMNVGPVVPDSQGLTFQ